MSIERQLVFIAVFIGVLALINLYVYRRLFSRLTPHLARFGAALMLMIMGGEILFAVDSVYRFVPESVPLYLTLTVFVGATFILLVVTLVYDLTLSVSRRVPFEQERRKTIKVAFDATVLFAAAAYLGRGLAQGIRLPEVNDVAIHITDFPFDGFTIVQLSDIHVSRTIKRDFVEAIVARTNAIKPDMIAITGDLFDLPAHKAADDLEPLKWLEAPTFFVTGNHEYFHGVESALAKVRALGIKPLTNESVRFGNRTGSFNLVGLNDLTGDRFGTRPPDVEAAYSQLDPSKPTIVLSHQPKSISLVEDKRCDLMLCGHTHGGQIFPFGLLVILDQPYLNGLHQHRPGQQIFVSRGTGYWGPPLRVLAPSEISRIVITRA